MKSTVKYLLTFVSGFGLGFGIGYVILEKKFNERVDEEVESVKEYARRKIEANKPKSETCMDLPHIEHAKGIINETFNKVPTPSYKRTDILDQDEDENEDESLLDETKWADYNDPNDRMKTPYIIQPEEYSNTMLHFDKDTIYFYSGDGVFADEKDEIIDDPQTLLGDAAQYFGYLPEEPSLVYIRNYRFATDYELCKVDGTYQETILGEYMAKKSLREEREKPKKKVDDGWENEEEEDNDGWA